MRGNKKLIQGIAVAGAAGALVFTVNFSQPQIMQTEGTIQITDNGTAGIMAALNPSRHMGDLLSRTVTVSKRDVYQVSAGISAEKFIINGQTAATDARASIVLNDDEESDNNDSPLSSKQKAVPETNTPENNSVETAGKVNSDQSDLNQTDRKDKTDSDQKDSAGKESKNNKSTNKKDADEKNSAEKNTSKKNSNDKDNKNKSDEQEKWKNKLIADVDDYLNIRKTSSEDSEIVGKLRKGDVAKVMKKGKAWTKIKSGSVTGYVKNDYCIYGTKAYKLAKKICKTYATVQADGLRIRQQANKSATVLEAAFKGDRLVVNTDAKKKDGWVVVKFNDKKGYVADKYVKVALGGRAISIAEEKAQLAALKNTSSNSAGIAAASSASSVSSSDLTLLSAIIFCEAGGESYSGQVAVGAVVMNRVRSSSFPNSISGVVYQSGQFSPVANGALARALSNGSYQYCVQAARAALAGNDNTGGAQFFHRANGAAGLVIGNHVFY